METITVSEFQEEMQEIEKIQDKVDDILHNHSWLYTVIYLKKAIRLHNQAGNRMIELYSKELIDGRCTCPERTWYNPINKGVCVICGRPR